MLIINYDYESYHNACAKMEKNWNEFISQVVLSRYVIHIEYSVEWPKTDVRKWLQRKRTACLSNAHPFIWLPSIQQKTDTDSSVNFAQTWPILGKSTEPAQTKTAPDILSQLQDLVLFTIVSTFFSKFLSLLMPPTRRQKRLALVGVNASLLMLMRIITKIIYLHAEWESMYNFGIGSIHAR